MARITKRARHDWQKEARGREILEAATRLFAASGRLPAMADVATEAGVAKGTLYLYFKSREALWLALLESSIGRWVGAIAAWVPTPAAGVAGLVETIIAGAEADPMLIPLAISNAVLIEPNAGPEAADRFKGTTADHTRHLGALLAERLGMSPAEGISRVVQTYALLIGLWQMAVPTAGMPRDVDAPPSFWKLDWRREASTALAALWQRPSG